MGRIVSLVVGGLYLAIGFYWVGTALRDRGGESWHEGHVVGYRKGFRAGRLRETIEPTETSTSGVDV
jgi:hypothetical protein